MKTIKMNTNTGQVYYDSKCLHKDAKGYYTISSTRFGKAKMQLRNDIVDPNEVERLDKFCNN